jgi:hypothetical protein
MIVAVLKNRLLQLTDRQFREEDFGADSLLELVARHRDLVAIDRNVKPVVVEWVGTPTAIRPTAPAGRVRPDLWRAMLDFSSGLHYEWDIEAGQARPVETADPALRLPTLDPTTLASWRTAFVKEHEAAISNPEDLQRLRDWATHALGSQGLPRPLRARWNEHLKNAVVARLTCWFLAAGRPVPAML